MCEIVTTHPPFVVLPGLLWYSQTMEVTMDGIPEALFAASGFLTQTQPQSDGYLGATSALRGVTWNKK